MSNWKELKIDNLPPDILTGDYKFQVLRKTEEQTQVYSGLNWVDTDDDGHNVLYACDQQQYRYHKPEPKQPTMINEISAVLNKYKHTMTLNPNGTFTIEPEEE